MKDLTTRDFEADPNRIRKWINSYGFPENVRVEVDDDAPEELKSLVSSMDSQKVSRTETPIENIVRIPSPKFDLPAPDTPVTVSSETDDNNQSIDGKSSSDSSSVKTTNETTNQRREFGSGEVFDPRLTVALEKIASLEKEVVEASERFDKADEKVVELRHRLELVEMVNYAPDELKRTFRKETGELSTQLLNMIKQLELRFDEEQKNKSSSKPSRMDLASDETANWFRTKFKAELGFYESKNTIKGWIRSELNSYQVFISGAAIKCMLYRSFGIWIRLRNYN